ncbi:MAG: amidohydrolase [Deltaproteobacteria bacterium]|nr:amidohydrolase [Deltaproteobacteria bacterium]
MKFDIVVYNGIIVTVNPDFDIIDKGVVCIRNGMLERIGPWDEDVDVPAADRIINAKGGIVMPGLVNTHTHLPMSLFRGLADDLPLMTWLNEHIFPAESKYINPESVRLGTLLSCSEMILSGTTTCCDGYFHEDEVAKAVCDSGMRAVLGQGVIDFPAPGVPDPKNNIKTAVDFTEKWQGVNSAVTPSIFCHSPYTCSAGTLKKAKDAAASKGLLFQIHVAETRNERDRILSEHHVTPIQYLDKIGILDRHTLLVHAIWVDEADMEIIAKRDAKISHNPESNTKLAAGIAPVPEFIKAGITVGLGTDGCASNNNLDFFQEMDTAAKLHKVNTLDPTVLDAGRVIKMATIDGAKAIGLGRETGSLEIGKQADIIIIDINRPHWVPMYHPVSHIVYTAKGSDVTTSIVNGKLIMKDGSLLTMDVEDIMKDVNRIAAKIRKEHQ